MIPITRRLPVAVRAVSSTCLSPSSRNVALRCRTQHLALRSANLAPGPLRSFSSYLPRQDAVAAAAEPQVGEQEGEITTFQQLGDSGKIDKRIIKTITDRMNIHTMTDVQRMTLNHCLDGTDVIAQARTGTGKTMAFLLPIIQRTLNDPAFQQEAQNMHRGSHRKVDSIRAVVISPTRELAEQIAVEASKLTAGTPIRVQTAVGGTQKRYHLEKMHRDGCHILVGTPGRITDILSDPSTGVSLEKINTFVLDEADRLLDIGFAPAIAEIQGFMPKGDSRQNLMFSATVPQSVVNLVRQTLRPNFKFVRTIDPDEPLTHERVPQNVVFARGLQNQIPIIMEIAHNANEAHKKDPANNKPFKAIVYFGSTAETQMCYSAFSSMRDPTAPRSMFTAHPLAPLRLFQMHGKLEQARRTRESQGFRNSESALLFSTDVTARGMDFPDVTHVIQVGIPRSAEDYTHRIGRTGRAGKSGEGWLILNADERQDIAYKMRDSGVDLKEATLVTSDLDMTRGAQIPSHIARLLKLVEIGVKNVPYDMKSATYNALIGVLEGQNPRRSKQDQIDMMNQLAKFGWGMAEPPAIGARTADRARLRGITGVRISEGSGRGFGDRDQGGFGFGGRGERRGSASFDKPRAPSGRGVFGGDSGEDPFAALNSAVRDRGRAGRSGRSDRSNRGRW